MTLSEKIDTEVLIAGAGPVGLMMACQLSIFDIRFRIIDKNKAPASYSGAMVIHAKTLEIFQQMGLAEEILRLGTRVNALSVIINGEKKSRLQLKDFGAELSPFSSVFLMEQSKTEKLLLEFLQKSGTKVEWNTELVDLNQDNKVVTVFLKKPGQKKEVIKSQYLVAADGGQSRVRNLLDITFAGKTHSQNLCILECQSNIQIPRDEICFSFSKYSTTGFFPVSDGRWRIDAALMQTKKDNNPLSFHDVQDNFRKNKKLNVDIWQPDFFSVFHSHGKVALTYTSGHCFLVGDAAHLFTPVGAQGMNTGLQDAQNLAWKLAMVIRHFAVPALTDTYEEERKPVAEKISGTSDFFFRMVASPHFLFRAIRKHGLNPAVKLLFRLLKKKRFAQYIFGKIAGTGIIYHSPLFKNGKNNGLKSAPKPGERLPYFCYKKEGKEVNIRDNLRQTTFNLVIFSGNSTADKLMKIAENYSPVLKSQIIPFSKETKKLYKQFGIKSAGWYLVRPDMHIAWCSNNIDNQRLKLYLNKFLIPNQHEKSK